MKLTAIIVLSACITASAKSGAQGITLSVKNASLEKVFTEIKKQTGYSFVYNNSLIANTKKISLTVSRATVDEVLQLAFKDQPLTYEIIDKTIIVKPQSPNLTDGVTLSEVEGPPPIDIHGRILNEKGEPVAATIMVKGTNKGTTTNDNGEFELKGISNDAVLVISGVSIESFEWKVNGKTELVLNAKIKTVTGENVNVVVNTGYQKITKERFVGSFSQMDSENFHRREGMNIIERLDGTVPGVLFNKKGSASYSNILIRGLSTLGNNGTPTEPLIVIDNFPMPSSFDINNINPNDVETLTVLKDASASSIWGARAGNGVIVITTKKGKYNQQFHIDISSNVTIQNKPDLYYYKQISTSDYIDIEKDLFSKGAYDAAINNFNMPVLDPVVEILSRKKAGLISQTEADNQISVLRNYNLRKELNKYVYRKAIFQQHFLNFSGGTNVLAYQISAGFNRSLNNIQHSKPNEQFTINTNESFKPVRNLEIITGINLAFDNNRSTGLPSLPNYPYARLVDDNGAAQATPMFFRLGYADTVGGGNLLDWHYRPIDEIRLANNSSTSKFGRLNLGLSYQFASWLKANVNYQYQNNTTATRIYNSLQTFFARNLINQFTNLSQTDPNLRYPVPVGGILDLSEGLSKDYNLRGTFNFNKTFDNQHELTALMGAEIYDSKGGYSSHQTIYGYDDKVGTYPATIDYLHLYPTFYAPSIGGSSFIPNPNSYLEGTINRTVSVLGNVSYNFSRKYFVYASVRRDGANVFGVKTNNQWKPLWSVGTGWEVSKEKFYNVSWLPYLKLRGSYGYTGNANNILSGLFTIKYQGLDRYSGLSYSTPNLAPNYNLKWEEVGIVNIAMDFQAFDRIRGSFEVYRKKASDVIAEAPMPQSSGVNTFVKNYADMKTNGYEINVNSKNIKGKIGWTTSMAWSHAKTIVTKLFTTLGYKVNDYIAYDLNAIPGQVIYGVASYQWKGLDSQTGDPLGYYNGQVSKDYNAIINDSVKNQVFHGSALPLNSAFLRNNVTWKSLTLSLNLTGRFNYYFREPALDISSAVPLSADYYKRWQKSGDESSTNIPSIYYPVPSALSQRNTFYQYASTHVKRADNIRMQDISLSYQWNNYNEKKIPIQTIRLFVYTNNLNWIIWRAENSDWDPDFSGGAAGSIYTAPIPKTWTVGATINF